MGRYPQSPEELSSWASHFRECPPDHVLMRRIAAELIELRCLIFNIHRDTAKMPAPVHPAQIAPDIFGEYDEGAHEREVIDKFGEQLMQEITNAG